MSNLNLVMLWPSTIASKLPLIWSKWFVNDGRLGYYICPNMAQAANTFHGPQSHVLTGSRIGISLAQRHFPQSVFLHPATAVPVIVLASSCQPSLITAYVYIPPAYPAHSLFSLSPTFSDPTAQRSSQITPKRPGFRPNNWVVVYPGLHACPILPCSSSHRSRTMTRKRELVNDSASHRQRTSGPQERHSRRLAGRILEK